MRTAIVLLFSVIVLSGCKGTGFKDLGDPRHVASVEAAREVMTQVQAGLRAYYNARHTYPNTTEAGLYDSIHSYMNLDPAQLYRNDIGKGYYIAIGGRANRLVYHYPATIGPGEYTLYWIGPNGIDEEGEGDDVAGWETDLNARKLEQRRSVDLLATGTPQMITVIRTGPDYFKDSVLVLIQQHDSVLYRDSWPISNYFKARPELSEADRKEVVREELKKILLPSRFVRTDSLPQHSWNRWVDFKPGTPSAADIVKRNELMFNYYTGSEGSRGIAWDATKGKFIRVWQSF